MENVDKNLEIKLRRLDALHLWTMIVALIVSIMTTVLVIQLLVGILKMVTFIYLVEEPANYSFFEISVLLGNIAMFTLKIFVAVQNNNKQIQNFYDRAGIGSIPGILAIVGLFVVPFILSVVLYIMTHKALTRPNEALEKQTLLKTSFK